MKNLGNTGCRILTFKSIVGLSKNQLRSIYEGEPNPRINKDTSVYVCDIDGDEHRLHSKSDDARIGINGNTILFDHDSFTVEDI